MRERGRDPACTAQADGPFKQPESLKAAADKCAKELGGIDFVM